MKRRTLLAAALAAPTVARAQSAWPTRPIRWIVPFAPGGGTDTVSRLIADQLSRSLGQTVVVDNKGGAGGNIGTVELARAAPDGYTLFLAALPQIAVFPAMTKASYDPVKDFAPISNIGVNPFVLMVYPGFPVTTVAEFVARAGVQLH